jgi:putative redox protein
MINSITKDTYKTELSNGTHTLVADEPLSNGGTDLGLSPMELLAAALASCTSITLRMYIDRSKWQVDEIDVKVDRKKNEDTAEIEFEKYIVIKGDIDDKQRDRLLYIAGKCPVHKVLSKNTLINSTIEIK